MKKYLLLFFLLPSFCFAGGKVISGLNANGSSVVIIPGSDTKIILIQNTGSNDVRLTVDGGVTATGGHNPTPSSGYLLKAGAYLFFGTGPYTGATPDPTLHKAIVAIMATSTTTLDIETDGTGDQFPTN